ncbi:polyphenol oxidase family protein [Gleimia sp. 6138-11-ORH1]|uniref:polyphenol oxidase family protein n=1 Tax=Gleimia sp. 6138-11-ORH1 TaxID=2973937 RepID=UPI0021697B12|nr:polyphenol oxidase family protein [Gleimia sp. 6138-11-ORH1]MCS4484535.1 polyphenol oxidase family protein [Gleimia sp. 6138-11-ORH1]
MDNILTVGGALVGFTRCAPTVSASNKTASQIYPNYGLNTPDEAARVTEFRKKLAVKLKAPIIWMEQTHSAEVATIKATELSENLESNENTVKADAVIVPAGTVAAVQIADCVPVIIIDPTLKLVAAVHAGRAGIEKEILAHTITKLVAAGSNPKNLYSAVGPCICENCYEVGEEIYQKYVDQFPNGGARTSWGTKSIRLRAIVVEQLKEMGIENIYHDQACTFESEDLNSYRKEPACGRQIGWAYFPTPETTP